WDVRTGQVRADREAGAGPVTAMAFRADGATLAVGGSAGVQLWGKGTGRPPPGPLKQGALARAFHPQGPIPAPGGGKTGKRWDLPGGRERRTLAGHGGPVLAVAYSPDGRTLASGGTDGVVRLWDAAGGEERRTLTAEGVVKSLAFSPDGKTVAAGIL